MTEIKICGLSTPATVDAAVAAGADYIGLVFFPKSPRNVDLGAAAALAARVPAHIGKVGVFVDPDEALLSQVRAQVGLTALQVHDVAQPARVAAIRARHGLPVWVALGVATSRDIADGRRYLGAANRLLFDAKTPKGADLPGGMGLRFDWRLLDAARGLGLPWGLAGGLDPTNVKDAIATSGAGLVDVSSGVETAPGVKSERKIKAFVEAVRAA